MVPGTVRGRRETSNVGSSNKKGPDAAEAAERLFAGNRRYVAGEANHPNQSGERRVEVADGQAPFAVVLGCSDSRVPPELIFDAGLGDLFVIRVAGNIVDDAVLGSIEYAAVHLGTPLVVALGHASCGAVRAAVSGGDAEGHLPCLISAIRPAVEKAECCSGDRIDHTIRANAKLAAEQMIERSPILAGLVRAGELHIIAAYYDLATGRVEQLA